MSAGIVLPDVLYVKHEVDGEDGYFVADRVMDNLAELGDTVRVGVYKLVGLNDVDLVIDSRSVKGR